MNSMKSLGFERLIWLGSSPLGHKRKALLAAMSAFVGLEPEFLMQYESRGTRDMCLANFEEPAVGSLRPDSKSLFLGVLGATLPSSEQLLSDFNDFKYTFFLQEDTEFSRVEDYLSDLLQVKQSPA